MSSTTHSGPLGKIGPILVFSGSNSTSLLQRETSSSWSRPTSEYEFFTLFEYENDYNGEARGIFTAFDYR